ncbi:MAG: helix-turn-helix domain-containing protein [Clostridia bacterium]|nr:helix-turn-helix domain-containing protein [Clostridia bacterium]
MNYKYHLDNSYHKTPLFFGQTRLWQIGRLYCKPSNKITAHKQPQDVYELTVVTSGKGTVYINGEGVPVRAGDIHLAFPEELHEIVSDGSDPLHFDFFSFVSSNEEYRGELLRISAENRDVDKRVFHDDSICDFVRSGIREINVKDKYFDKMMANICEQIIISVIRSFERTAKGEQKNTATDADSLCYQAMDYIDSHLFSMRSLTEISDSMNYNYSYLSNLFKKNMGQGLLDYYRIRRLEISKRLLLEKGRNITQIAEMLNYSSVYAFSRAFRAQYGISPNQYKKNNASDIVDGSK